MCGAYSQFTDFGELEKRFHAKAPKEKPVRYNIRPAQAVAVILNTSPDEITYAMWGIHPYYDRTGKLFFINARTESLEKPTWKKMLAEQRCLILADGFYEWQRHGKKPKVPFRFELNDRRPFAFAGLWQGEIDEAGVEVPHVAIITTEPNDIVAPVHDRMPVILRDTTAEDAWLNPDTEAGEALKLLQPYSASEMHSFPISPLINRPSNDSEDIIKPAQNSS